jgi:hypothetical protein
MTSFRPFCNVCDNLRNRCLRPQDSGAIVGRHCPLDTQAAPDSRERQSAKDNPENADAANGNAANDDAASSKVTSLHPYRSIYHVHVDKEDLHPYSKLCPNRRAITLSANESPPPKTVHDASEGTDAAYPR